MKDGYYKLNYSKKKEIFVIDKALILYDIFMLTKILESNLEYSFQGILEVKDNEFIFYKLDKKLDKTVWHNNEE